MFPVLPDKLTVRIDGRPVPLVPRRADIVRQEHAQLEFAYEIPFQAAGEPRRFDLVDENYAGVPGFHLAAIRGRGDVQVVPAGTRELLERLPDIPDPSDPEAPPLPTVRRLEAYIRAGDSATQAEATLPAAKPPAEPAGGSEAAVTADAATRDGRASDDDAIANPSISFQDKQDTAATETPLPSQDGRSPTGRTEGLRESRVGRLLWVIGFGALALTIAAAWLIHSLHRRT
jgi:hypothetical protein